MTSFFGSAEVPEASPRGAAKLRRSVQMQLSASAAEYRPTYSLQAAVKELATASAPPPPPPPPAPSLKLELLTPLPAKSSSSASSSDAIALSLLLSRLRRPSASPFPSPAPSAPSLAPRFTSRDMVKLRRRWWEASKGAAVVAPPLPPPPPPFHSAVRGQQDAAVGSKWHSVLRCHSPPFASSPPVPPPPSFFVSSPPLLLHATPKDRYPIHRAIANFSGDYSSLTSLLQRSSRASLNARNKSGQTPLHVSVSLGLPSVVSLVLSRGGSGSHETVDAQGFTPLAIATIASAAEIVELLLHSQSNSGSQRLGGKHRKDVSPSLHPLVLSSERGHHSVVQLLLSCTAPDPELIRRSLLHAVLHSPPGADQQLAVLACLVAALRSETPLAGWCAAPPLSDDKDPFESPLRAACRLNNAPALRALLAADPPPGVPSAAFDLSEGPAAVRAAAGPGEVLALSRLRAEQGARRKAERQDALIGALERGHLPCALELLRAGCDVDEGGARRYRRDAKMFKDVEAWRPKPREEMLHDDDDDDEDDAFYLLVEGGEKKVQVSKAALLRAYPKLQGAAEFHTLQSSSSSFSSAPSFLSLDVPLPIGLLLSNFAISGSLMPSAAEERAPPLLSPDPVERCHQLLKLIDIADECLCKPLLLDAARHLLLSNSGGGGDKSPSCSLLGCACVTCETAVDLLSREDVTWCREEGELRAVRCAAALFVISNFRMVLRRTEGFVDFFGGDVDKAELTLLAMVDEEVKDSQERGKISNGLVAAVAAVVKKL